MRGTTIVRDGRQQILLAAVAVDAAAYLADLDTVTVLLGDLIDQDASTRGPDHRWVVPPIGLGPLTLRVALLPVVERRDEVVRIVATSDVDSGVDVRLSLAMALHPLDGRLVPSDPDGTRLETVWGLRMVVPVPRLVLAGTGSALDRTVDRVVGDINRRVAVALGG